MLPFIMGFMWTVFAALVCYTGLVAGSFLIPELAKKTAIVNGDINLGVLMPMSNTGSNVSVCSDQLKDLEAYISSVVSLFLSL